MEKEKLFYTLREIREEIYGQEIYGQEISLATLQNMVHAGQIPSIRVMRRIFIPCWWVKQQIALAKGANYEGD